MAINEAQIRDVHATVRALFKGKTKSANKIYLLDKLKDVKITSAMQEKADARNHNAMHAGLQINQLRESKSYTARAPTSYGYEVLDQTDLAGNCVEMASAAAYLVMRARIGTAWFVGIRDPGDHVFCLVDNGVSAHPAQIKDYLICSADSWVIDPWANVCCKMQEYDALFSAKMQKWKKAGKYIVVIRDYKNEATIMNPAGYTYLRGFRTGRLVYYRASADVPEGVPKALTGALPDRSVPATSSRKKWECVIL
jgi:hypothetical protein